LTINFVVINHFKKIKTVNFTRNETVKNKKPGRGEKFPSLKIQSLYFDFIFVLFLSLLCVFFCVFCLVVISKPSRPSQIAISTLIHIINFGHFSPFLLVSIEIKKIYYY